MKSDNNESNDITTGQNAEINISDLPLEILLNDLFVERCSTFYNFDALVYHCDYSINSKDEFLALPADTLNTYIRNNTSYDSWEEMFGDAVAAYVESQLSNKTANHPVP